MNPRIFAYIVLAVIVTAIILLATQCPRKKETVIFKKGITQTKYIHGRTDTVKIAVTVHHYHASKIKIVHDTVTKLATTRDIIPYNGLQIEIDDVLKGDSVTRSVTITGTDTTRIVTRVDTVDRQRTDTLFITKEKKVKGYGIVFGAGYVLGFGTAIIAR